MEEKTEIKKESKIENFIGMYDNYITEEECNKAIKLFENQYKFNKTMNRQVFENASPLHKKDDQFFANSDNIVVWWDELKSIMLLKITKKKQELFLPTKSPFILQV